MNFRVGMPVAQIADWRETDTAYPDVKFTRRGVIYTIREVVLLDGKWPALRFNELRNPVKLYKRYGLIEQPFPIWNFRPAVSPKSETSFTQGAPLDSEQWDNRRLPARVKEIGASA